MRWPAVVVVRVIVRAGVCLIASIGLYAQENGGGRGWETLLRAPLPAGTAPTYSIFKVSSAPAPETAPTPGPGHTHEGPVFVYVVSGKMESQIEPDAPEVFSSGEFFYEAPGRVHRLFRNASRTEPANVLTFQVGYTGPATPRIKATLQTIAGQEVRLSRLSMRQDMTIEAGANENPDALYVLDGRIEVEDPRGQETYSAGDLVSLPADSRVKIKSLHEPAGLLLFQVSNPSPKDGQ